MMADKSVGRNSQRDSNRTPTLGGEREEGSGGGRGGKEERRMDPAGGA